VAGEKDEALRALSRAIELDAGIRERAKTNEGFESLWDDEHFKRMVY
jgi:hypothetical protein